MSRATLDANFKKLVAAAAGQLKTFGFKSRGRIIKAISDGNALIVEFQKSTMSSEQKIVFTINLGIVCGELLDPQGTDLARATILDAHVRDRLGMLLVPPVDKWWELTATTQYDCLSQEVLDLLLSKGVPYLEQYASTQAIIAMWDSGESPGLTAVQRSRFLSELKSKKG